MREGNATVTAIMKTENEGFKHSGAVVAHSNCWSMLKGGLTLDSSGLAELYFEVYIFDISIYCCFIFLIYMLIL